MGQTTADHSALSGERPQTLVIFDRMQAIETAVDLDVRAEALNAQLVRIKRDLAELRSRDALKTQFLSNISHDLRTPLTAIITHGEILRDGLLGDLTDRQKESVEGIISGGRQMLNMVAEILTFARGAANRLTLQEKEFELKEFVSRVASINEALVNKRGLKFEAHIADDLPLVWGDPDKIRHVINNLIGNAIDFTAPGGKVWVAARLSKQNGRSFHVIEVGDTGVGIDEKHFELIFEEFAQVDSSAARPHHGTGLGLTIARRFVELHGGRIWLTSEVGKGTQFYFSIPQREASANS